MGLMTRRKLAVCALVALPALGLGGLPLSAQQQQDSSQQATGDAVADAARKAREQKKKETAKPKRVITDEDVNHLVLPDSPPEKPEAGAENGAKPAGEQAGPDNGKKEESPEIQWRKRFKEAYKNLARAEKELDVLQREDNKAQVQYYSDPQKAMAEQYTRKEINEKDTKIAAKKKEVDQLKQQISDMEDQLRKSGGDPGWAAP